METLGVRLWHWRMREINRSSSKPLCSWFHLRCFRFVHMWYKYLCEPFLLSFSSNKAEMWDTYKKCNTTGRTAYSEIVQWVMEPVPTKLWKSAQNTVHKKASDDHRRLVCEEKRRTIWLESVTTLLEAFSLGIRAFLKFCPERQDWPAWELGAAWPWTATLRGVSVSDKGNDSRVSIIVFLRKTNDESNSFILAKMDAADTEITRSYPATSGSNDPERTRSNMLANHRWNGETETAYYPNESPRDC